MAELHNFPSPQPTAAPPLARGPYLLLLLLLILACLQHGRYAVRYGKKAWNQRMHGSQSARLLSRLPAEIPGLKPFKPVGFHCDATGVKRSRARGMAQFHWVPAIVLEAPKAPIRLAVPFEHTSPPSGTWWPLPNPPAHPMFHLWVTPPPGEAHAD